MEDCVVFIIGELCVTFLQELTELPEALNWRQLALGYVSDLYQLEVPTGSYLRVMSLPGGCTYFGHVLVGFLCVRIPSG